MILTNFEDKSFIVYEFATGTTEEFTTANGKIPVNSGAGANLPAHHFTAIPYSWEGEKDIWIFGLSLVFRFAEKEFKQGKGARCSDAVFASCLAAHPDASLIRTTRRLFSSD